VRRKKKGRKCINNPNVEALFLVERDKRVRNTDHCDGKSSKRDDERGQQHHDEKIWVKAKTSMRSVSNEREHTC